MKEIQASQQTNLPQSINYSGLFTNIPAPFHIETALVPYETIRMWQLQLEQLRSSYTNEKVPFFYNDYVRLSYGDSDYPDSIWDRGIELESLGIMYNQTESD